MLQGAIVGFGEVASGGHWPAYVANPDASIVAVVDPSADRRALAAARAPTLRTFATLRDLAASGLPLDFVDVCTPPSLHPQPMLEALGYGWHVLCEKPFVLDRSVLPALRQRADEHGVAIVPVHNWKYAPILVAATERLHQGAIGQLTHIDISTTRTQAAATAEGGVYNWRHDAGVAGGGILMDHGWHALYLVLHWFGERAATASIRQSRLTWPGAAGVENEASVTLGFAGGDASIFLTWYGQVRKNAVRLVGNRGEIVVDDDTLRVTGAAPFTQTFPSALSAGSHHADWFTAMLPDVVACFREPSRSRPLFNEAAQCLALIEDAYRLDASLASTRS